MELGVNFKKITEHGPNSQTLTKNINCFVFDSKGQLKLELFKFNERIEIRLLRKLNKGRSRLNCTVKDKNNNWNKFLLNP